MEHRVNVIDRVIAVKSDRDLVRHNVGVDTLTARFKGDMWDGIDHISVFFKNGDTVIRQTYEDGMKIPWEVMQTAGAVLLTFKGYRDGGVVVVTEQMVGGIAVVPCGYCMDGEDPKAESPSEFQQLMIRFGELESEIADIRSQLGQIIGGGESGNLEELQREIDGLFV